MESHGYEGTDCWDALSARGTVNMKGTSLDPFDHSPDLILKGFVSLPYKEQSGEKWELFAE